ncbi:MAG: glutamine--fructose-6-phosphate transaminase (isomerizing) [Oligoflexales bacterium]|nr:glutamine--fructose-6-phosphate transaminase (isomerizing) [Oligoflexales bacterium]
MCGIIGYNGKKPCVDLIYSGLQKLEYRGYDSSGVAVLANDKINLVKQKGKLSHLLPFLGSLPQDASLGMGHTRWATHGVPSTENAHPHGEERVSIVHNGILENYNELKIKLLEKGQRFLSETDSEVIVHLLHDELEVVADVRKAILNIVDKLQGAYALGIMVHDHPDDVYVVKQASPLVIGVGEGENFFASDALALLAHTKKFIFLSDGEIARIGKDGVEIWDFYGAKKEPNIVTVDSSEASLEKGGYRHYMLKEIYEQPTVLANTIQRMVCKDQNSFDEKLLCSDKINLTNIRKVHVVACGTAYYAGMMGKYILEPKLEIPVEVELASEFRYRDSFIDDKTLIIAVTQSGETADTLASIKHAKSKGCKTLAICNVPYSSIPRECDATIYMEAGPEIGVASTKAFTSMVLNFYLLGLAWGQRMGTQSQTQLQNSLESLVKLPSLIEQALSHEALISEIAGSYFEDHHCLFVGRGHQYPIALEGALKLKEISYIHAEGYAGGELKHGPIALIDRSMPVLAIAPPLSDYEKVISNLEEIYAREGRILGLGLADDQKLKALCSHVIPCPFIDDPALQAILCSVPLQLFAYSMAIHRGTDVDQPRNLAKSVTVE